MLPNHDEPNSSHLQVAFLVARCWKGLQSLQALQRCLSQLKGCCLWFCYCAISKDRIYPDNVGDLKCIGSSWVLFNWTLSNYTLNARKAKEVTKYQKRHVYFWILLVLWTKQHRTRCRAQGHTHTQTAISWGRIVTNLKALMTKICCKNGRCRHGTCALERFSLYIWITENHESCCLQPVILYNAI